MLAPQGNLEVLAVTLLYSIQSHQTLSFLCQDKSRSCESFPASPVAPAEFNRAGLWSLLLLHT